MISKTLDQWIVETEKYGNIYHDKYSESWSDERYSASIRKHYFNVSKQNTELRELLHHIKTYGMRFNMILNTGRCSACHGDPRHIQRLTNTYSKYQKWIDYVVSQPR
jgi:hypothetical protein